MLLVCRPGNATPVIEEVVGVERLVAHEVVCRAVKRVGTGLRSEAHDAAAGLTEFGFEAVGIDCEFSDRFDRGCVVRNPI